MDDQLSTLSSNQYESVQCMDEAIAFYIQTFEDQDFAFHRALQLRRQYPGARILVRSDGGGCRSKRWGDFGIEFFNEERLFTISNGGMVVQRMLELHLQNPRPYLIKIDPDTLSARRLDHLPGKEGLFGTLQGPFASRSIQGGFIGITLNAALAIIESRLLLDETLKEPDRSIDPYMLYLKQRANRTGLTSFDTLLGWCASRLGIEMFDFPEVSCDWKVSPDNQGLRWAMIHPDPGREYWINRRKD